MLARDTTTFRAAHVSEATTIARLSRLHVEHGLRWRWTPRRVRQAIRHAETMVLVASVGGSFAGFAIMRFGDEVAHLHLLAVDAPYRRAGVARGLLRWLESSCRTAGMQQIRLEVRGLNRPARRFYEAEGFAAGERIGNYYGRDEDALVYRKYLRRAG